MYRSVCRREREERMQSTRGHCRGTLAGFCSQCTSWWCCRPLPDDLDEAVSQYPSMKKICPKLTSNVEQIAKRWNIRCTPPQRHIQQRGPRNCEPFLARNTQYAGDGRQPLLNRAMWLAAWAVHTVVVAAMSASPASLYRCERLRTKLPKRKVQSQPVRRR